MMLLVSGWSAWSVPEVAERWFAPHELGQPCPGADGRGGGAAHDLAPASGSGANLEVFLLAILVFLLGFAGLVVSLWPYVVPRQVTVWDGMADPRSVDVRVHSGSLIIMPIVLVYQANAYRIFRGKTRCLDGYDGVVHAGTQQSR